MCSITSVVYMVFSMILNNRLSEVVGEFHLLAEEQGSFWKGRGCQDQVLTLLLVAQSSVEKKKEGCLTTFIDVSIKRMIVCIRGNCGCTLKAYA